ncbi:MAG TPA: ATP synthase F1 subunit epsilon [Candidatus Methylacidiphilales bacterium]|jgi:F-type H+-transporting ATPase subunit epsilon|nr:ATP synthase F1 subunit epsilon [Candidatus Methylacidiphilales bacterium]
MATLKLEIITPEAKIFEGDVDSVQLPGVEGDMGILPQHEALVTELNAGELIIVQQGKTDVLAIGEGFAEITGTSVGVLTDGAVHEKEIDEKAAEIAVKRAEELLKSSTLQGEELEATQAALARSLAQIKVKRRRHGG